MFSPCGDREVLRVLRQGRMPADVLAFADLLALMFEVLVCIAMGSGLDEWLRQGAEGYEVVVAKVCQIMNERAIHVRKG